MSNRPPVRLDMRDPDVDMSVVVRVAVTLDGVPQTLCTAYDCERGFVQRYMLGPDGKEILSRDGISLAEEIVHGVVTVDWQADERN